MTKQNASRYISSFFYVCVFLIMQFFLCITEKITMCFAPGISQVYKGSFNLYGMVNNLVFSLLAIFLFFVCLFVRKKYPNVNLRPNFFHIVILYIADTLFYSCYAWIQWSGFTNDMNFMFCGFPLSPIVEVGGRLIELIVVLILSSPHLHKNVPKVNFRLIFHSGFLPFFFVSAHIFLVVIPFFLRGATADFFHECMNLLLGLVIVFIRQELPG